MATSSDFLKFRDAIESMPQDEMFGVLKDLISTRAWVAILKYQQARRSMAADSLLSMDPVQNPSAISKTQGILAGLSDLEDLVFRLNEPEKKDEEN